MVPSRLWSCRWTGRPSSRSQRWTVRTPRPRKPAISFHDSSRSCDRACCCMTRNTSASPPEWFAFPSVIVIRRPGSLRGRRSTGGDRGGGPRPSDVDAGGQALGQLLDVGDDADHPPAAVQLLERLDDDVQRLRIQGPEALVEEQAVERLAGPRVDGQL